MNIEEIKKKVIPILKRYHVKKAGIFGSVARGEETEESDIDILVEIDDRMSLLDFVGLKLELEDALGKKVDLGEYSTIKPLIREQILSEEVSIL
jgi:hypothetical protein